MQMRPMWRAVPVAVSAAMVLGGTTLAGAATGQPGQGGTGHSGGIRHVLLLSVDGLHQQDLAWYVRHYPHSVLAALTAQGMEYSNAETPFPSDSTPGMTAQVTGGNPRSTGLYYDDTWNHDVFPAGTTKCTGPVPGGAPAASPSRRASPQCLGRARSRGRTPPPRRLPGRRTVTRAPSGTYC